MIRPLNRTSAHRRLLAIATCGATAALLAGCSSGHGDGASASSGATSAAAGASCSSKPAPRVTGTTLPYDAAAPTGSSSALQIRASTPTVSSLPSGKDGFSLVQVPITASVRTNGTFAIDRTQFVLADRQNRSCAQPDINPLSSGFVALTVDETHQGSGSVAFLVPSSVKPSQLSLRYLPAAGANSASLAWRTGAVAPRTKVGNSCDGKKSTYALTSGAGKASFGSTLTNGNSIVSASIRPSTPTRRVFKPGPNQPNDVDAIDVKLHVSAHGADAYVDRRSFVLADGTGTLCRSSSLSSQGETLTSTLVKSGHSADYTIVFWAPKGSAVHGMRLMQLIKPGSNKVQSSWSNSSITLKPTNP